ncbi:MAG: hypothetical protein D6717_02195 [Gammaproteobacteria bacterium]|nr:MAG: hypothetical protein D6717_02195 [Gammaproteobacteria bacterium]
MSSGEIALQERDQKILDHIGRYRITLRPVLDQVFFAKDSSGCGNVLRRLTNAGLVTAREGLPSRRRYYQLTAKGAEGRVPLGRTKPMRAQALRSAIAVLWFCTMNQRSRQRMEAWELREILAGSTPAGTHCIQPGTPTTVFRVQVPSGRTKTAGVVSALRDHMKNSFQRPVLKQMAKDQRYGFAVLAEAERTSELRAAIARHNLARYAPIIIESVPSPQTITRALNDR